MERGEPVYVLWGITSTITALAASMVVNVLVTGLMLFKILDVVLNSQAHSVDQTSGIGPWGIISVISQSSMALFAIQLIRIVISSLMDLQAGQPSPRLQNALELVTRTHQILNVIITSVLFSTSFVLLMTFTCLGHRTNNNSCADHNGRQFWGGI